MKKNILAVILARGGSKGIKNKNISILQNHPLIAYTITAALESQYIDDVVVSTDSNKIAEIAIRYGAQVPFIRPDDLSGDLVASVDALLHACLETEKILKKSYEYVIELPCVAPLRSSNHVDEALSKLLVTGCDSVIGVTCLGEKHPIRIKKIEDDQIHDFCQIHQEPNQKSRRQELKPDAYIRNGSIYAMRRDVLVNQKTRHGSDSRAYIMKSEHSVNIDEPIDLKLAEFFISQGFCDNNPKIKPEAHKVYSGKPLALVSLPVDEIKKENLFSDKLDCIFVPRATKENIVEHIGEAVVLVTQPCPEYQIDESILGAANKLRIVATASTGTNHIDTMYCANNGIKVLSLRNTKDLETITSSSEFTFGLLLSLMRNTMSASKHVLLGRWRESEYLFRGFELQGKTLGIVGYGRIGSNNSKYANAFGMNVIAYDPYVKDFGDWVDVATDLKYLLNNSDVVMVCVHLDDKTEGMVDYGWFDQMKNGSYFINTSRGEVVNELALLHNLKSKKISAGLDVISDEFSSHKNTHRLIEYARNNSNILLTPHIAGLTYDSESKAAEIIMDKILEALSE